MIDQRLRAFVILVVIMLVAAACRSTTTLEAVSAVESEEPTAQPDETQPDEAPAVADGQLGGDTPLATVELLLQAMNAGDPLGVLAMIDRPERELIDRLYADVLFGLEQEWPGFAGASDIAALGPEITTDTLSVEELSPYLAWVSTPEVRVTLTNPTDTVAGLFADYWYVDGEVTDQSAGTKDLFGIDFGLVLVERDGRWFVSLARTPFEVVRRDAGLPSAFTETRPDVVPNYATSPEVAVENFTAGVESGDLTELASTLVPGEAQVIADYQPVMRDWLLSGLEDMTLTVDVETSLIVSQEDGRAIVEVPTWFVSANGIFDDNVGAYRFTAEDSVEGTDTCIFWRGPDNGRTSGCAPVSDKYGQWASIAYTLGWGGARLVAVESDDGWLVSLFDTAELWVGPHVESPLFTLLLFPWWESRAALPVIINSQAMLLPVQETGTIETKLIGHDLFAIARIQTGPNHRLLTFNQPRSYCDAMVFDTNSMSSDWSEGPDNFFYDDDFKCEEGLPLPPNVELTVVLFAAFGEPMAPLTFELGT